MLAFFDPGIDQAQAVLEKWRQIAAGNVEILVNGCRQYLATVIQVPIRVICAATEKGDTVGGARNDHSVNGEY